MLKAIGRNRNLTSKENRIQTVDGVVSLRRYEYIVVQCIAILNKAIIKYHVYNLQTPTKYPQFWNFAEIFVLVVEMRIAMGFVHDVNLECI